MPLMTMFELYNIGKSYIFGAHISPETTPTPDYTTKQAISSGGMNRGKRAINEYDYDYKNDDLTPRSFVVTDNLDEDAFPVDQNNKSNKTNNKIFKTCDEIFLSDIQNSSLMKRRRKKQKIKELSKHTNNKNRNRIRSF